MTHKFPAPTRSDHQAFCETEQWTRIRSATGKTGTHHITYELVLPDGTIIRTRISHPPDRSTYGKGIWSHILTEQLHVSEVEFWACVHDKTMPDRGRATPSRPGVPASLVHQLVVTFHVPEAEVAALSKQEAIERLAALWSRAD